MTRVGFIIEQFGTNWIGGLNYYRNLFYAIQLEQLIPIKVVLIVPLNQRTAAIKSFPNEEILVSKFIQKRTVAHLARKIVNLFLGRNLLLERFLKLNGISILSHGPVLGYGCKIPTIIWIPDFQHVHLPQFFNKREIMVRNQRQLVACAQATRIVVSSQSAKSDLLKLFPQHAAKTRVLRFSPKIAGWEPYKFRVLREKYPIPEKYIFLPNQFWAHKNHLLAFEAISRLWNRGQTITIVCTGAKEDYRNQAYIERVDCALEFTNSKDNIIILGVVPYDDMLSLMYYSHAVINPSLFEGWSSTVEEAKVLGRPLVLSSIAAHHASSLAPIVNGGTGIPVAVSEVIESLKSSYKTPGALKFTGSARSGDPQYLVCSNSAAKAWGWHPQNSAKEGFAAYANWYSSQQ
jgi:glycosyltransferase involved in cell wall biosynthesis